MRAGWILVAAAACGGGPSGDRGKVTRFTDDRGRAAVGIKPDAEATRAVEVLRAALAEAPEVAVVALEEKAKREVCVVKAGKPAGDGPVLSILVEPMLVWYGISRIDEFSMSAPSVDVIRAVGGDMAKDEWFGKDRYAELAFKPGVKGAQVITVIEALCPSWSSYRLLAPEALTSKPEPPPPAK